jgi:uncharacterized phiE125 gp8 family phage protein
MKPDTFRVIEWPVVEPVTLSEAKAQIGLSADQTEWDRLILDKIAAARRLIETRLAMTLVATKYRATWKEPAGVAVLELPAPPLLVDAGHPITVSVGGVALTAGQFSTDTDAIPGELILAAGAGSKLVVEYWGGVAPEGQICPMLKSAILAYVDHQFNNRGVLASDSATELPQAFDTLLAASSWNGGW